ncbi:MAG: NnrS family protein [Herbaspirillum sp.]
MKSISSSVASAATPSAVPARLRNAWNLQHPLWLCGFRPFFLLSALSAAFLMIFWSIALWFGLPPPPVVGGMLVWHAHELLFGFVLAAVAGFALTAVPEFTENHDTSRSAVRWLVLLWLLGRVGFWLSGTLGSAALVLAALAHVGLLLGLLWLLGPMMWRDPQRKHVAFFWAFLALLLTIAGFYVDALRGVAPARWLFAFLGVMMTLIVIAMSRVSIVLVNDAIAEIGVKGVEYLARPPRRNLAIFCIAAYTIAEFFAPASKLSGWLALAAAAGLFNLLNDWHIGRALFRRWALMPYMVYLFMALGYGVMGWAILAHSPAFSAGRHLLTVGGLGLSTYVVICIAGRMHCGYTLDERIWLPLGATLLVCAALLRAGVALPGANAALLMAAAGLCWVVAYLLCVLYLWPLFMRPRPDDGAGCAGPVVRV